MKFRGLGVNLDADRQVDPGRMASSAYMYGDDPSKGFKEHREFWLKLVAGTASPLGSLLAAPQITQLIRNLNNQTSSVSVTAQVPVLYLVLGTGILLMSIGLILIPLYLWRERKNSIDSGASGRLARRVDECVRAMTEFRSVKHNESGQDEVTKATKNTLFQKITTEAIHIIGNKARVCIYVRRALSGQEGEPIYVLESENSGDRNPKAQARPIFERNSFDGAKDFFDAIDNLGQRVIVQNVRASNRYQQKINKEGRRPFRTSPNSANGYHAFILVPIKSTSRDAGRRRTIGCVAVDFPGKNVITEEIEIVVSALAEMFSDSIESAGNIVFNESEPHSSVNSEIDDLLTGSTKEKQEKAAGKEASDGND